MVQTKVNFIVFIVLPPCEKVGVVENPTETGFYYLQSRYYDPEIGRFINADGVSLLNYGLQNPTQYNMFAYCWNNPVNMVDKTGCWPEWFIKLFMSDKEKAKYDELNESEKKLVKQNPIAAMNVQSYADMAIAKTNALFGNNADGTRANAFQHMYWNALMGNYLGDEKALEFSTAHESEHQKLTGMVKQFSDMDMMNNYIGIIAYRAYFECRWLGITSGTMVTGHSWNFTFVNADEELATLCYNMVISGYCVTIR